MSRSSFQPFLISEFKTGLFNYLEPWIRPVDAFDPLDNAYIYRGSLFKRSGYNIFGNISYQDNNIALGNGGKTYSGTLAVAPIYPGTFTPSDGIESFTDNGAGVLTGSAGGSGTINYTTGAWTLIFHANVASHTNIYAIYNPNVNRPIMGIKTWVSEATGDQLLIVLDTRRASVFNASTNTFDPLSGIYQVLWVGDNSTTSITFMTGWTAVSPYTNVLAPYSISITDGTSTITDNGSGGLTSSGNFAAGGTVNYATGAIALNFTSATTATIVLTADLVGDYFSGSSSNFFNANNWIAPAYYLTNPGILYMTNNFDPITTFDGTNLARPPFPITLAHYVAFVNDIATCLDVDVYKNRLLVERPLLVNTAYANSQSIRWSAINSPTNLAADVTGNGGELSAPTDDFIQSSEFLRDELIVPFTNSTWAFRFTGSGFAPFRWDKINNSKSTNAPYGTISYDERVTSMGSKGLIACDGINVQRYDNAIIDEFLNINQNRFYQCYGLRFDNINQSWMLYPSAELNSSLSDEVLVYNFIENTWSVYDIPMSCLGLFTINSDKTWNDFATTSSTPLTWEQAEFAWDSYLLLGLSPTLLGGSLSGGYVYQMNDGDADYPVSNSTPVPIACSITSARWNPFASTGQKVQFGYIDVYYEINAECVLDISFFADNSEAPATTRTLTLDGPTNSDVSWKRIFINLVGEFLRMNISNNQTAGFKILGLILWASPSGRLTPGVSVS